MKAVILAAGEGKRMHPLTFTRPKAMVYTGGKPLVWHVLHEVKKAGINEAIVIVKYRKEKILEYFRTNDIGMKLEFIEQDEKYGTGAALLSAEGKINNTFLVISSDIITDASVIKELIAFHQDRYQQEKGITVAAKTVENPKSYGVLQVNNEKVTCVKEKPESPDRSDSNLINTSIYVMDETIFPKLEAITPSVRREYELTDVLVGAKCIEIHGFWTDIAYPWQLFDVQDYLLQRMEANAVCGGKVENSTIKGKLIMEKDAEIFDSYIGEGIHYIGEGTKIGPHSCLYGNNSLGKYCEIGESTTVKNSILFDNVKAKHLTYIGDSIIGENVNFGAGTQIANYRFDEKVVSVLTESGLVNTERKKFGAVVGDNVKFGVLSCVMPGKTIENECWVNSGVVVNKNFKNFLSKGSE
ncbi:MAG: bifunctional sugar-1-phosphate nucleotidylyltransferase/acetyltransferase [Candidatus Micrarchaeota archaeon]